MNDDVLYEEVARELQSKAMIPGLWTRAFADAHGSVEQARALYIRYRVAQLAEARKALDAQQRQAAGAEARQNASAAFHRFVYSLAALACGVLTLFLGIGGIVACLSSAGTVVGGIFGLAMSGLFGVATCKFAKSSQDYGRN